MTQLINHLAEITGFRDRDQLDASVVRAVHDVLRPLSAGIYRSAGETGNQRWLTRARIALNDPAATADPPWTDIHTLPELDTVPARREALTTGEVVTSGHTPQTNHFPIATEREVVGVLEVQTAGPLSSGDRAMVATIVRIYGNFHDLLDHSERDPLTGLLNRQTFNAALIARTKRTADGERPESGRRASPGSGSLWLGVVDIDHFKRVNDSFGHDAGDDVLREFAVRLASNVRAIDLPVRHGGEEFVVVMPDTELEDARRIAERIRLHVAGSPFRVMDGEELLTVTISIGVACSAGAGDTASTLIKRADEAVYLAKSKGRNRVIARAA